MTRVIIDDMDKQAKNAMWPGINKAIDSDTPPLKLVMTISQPDVIRPWATEPSSNKNTTPSAFNTFRIDLIQNCLDIAPVKTGQNEKSPYCVMST